MSMAKGVQSQLTIAMTLPMACWPSQSTAGWPNWWEIQAKNPEVGLISMFFQTTAVTTGITRKLLMSTVRTSERPTKGRLSSMASSPPRNSVMTSVPPVSHRVFRITRKLLGSVSRPA